jgi:arginyl-tRNA synthetase
MFKIIELMGRKDIADKCQHENFGMVNGMSTRKGTVKFLDTVIEDVADYQHAVMKKNKAKYDQVENPDKVAETLAITSIMVQDMSSKRYIISMSTSQHASCQSLNNDTGSTTTTLVGPDDIL